jgi:hypothetical protein
MKGVFVGAVGRAAVFDDAQAAGRKLIVDPVVEQDHAVGDVFFQTIARQCAFAAFAGDDGGDALRLQPFEQPARAGHHALRPALSNIIEAANAGRRFAYRGQIAGLRARRTGHEEIFLWTQLQRPAWAGRNNRLPHLP